MISELNKQRVKAIYLDAIHGLENYYARQGFKIARRHRVLVTTINNLPSNTSIAESRVAI
ncbi:MAG: hypothetical protein J7K21_04765 [Desulfurococcales archaeon]|nr:hypothetical protein [Desulfurococcales archaeon]